MIRQALILADRKDVGIHGGDDVLPKPLHVVAGLTLIKRSILALSRSGITHVHVVLGFHGAQVRAAIEHDPAFARAGLTVELIENPDHERGDGVAVLKARGRLEGPFVVLTADHVHDPSIARLAAASDMAAADVHVCADASVVDDPLGCGVLAVGPAFVDALAALEAAGAPCTLADGVRQLRAAGRARVADVGNAFWQRVATAEDRVRAEDKLFQSLRKPTDGPISKVLNRRMSIATSRVLVRTSMTPNQITVVGSAIGFLGVYLVFQAMWWSVAVGAVLVHTQSVLDGCDGEIARLKYQTSRFGEWLDLGLDNVVNASYGLGLGLSSAALLGEPLIAWAGIIGATGMCLHDLNMYVQLAFVRKSGNEMNFRWWFQKEDQDNVIQSLAKGNNPIVTLAHGLVRRDVFLFCFMLLAIVRLPVVAAVWYGLIGAGHLVLVFLHVVSGGVRFSPYPKSTSASTG